MSHLVTDGGRGPLVSSSINGPEERHKSIVIGRYVIVHLHTVATLLESASPQPPVSSEVAGYSQVEARSRLHLTPPITLPH